MANLREIARRRFPLYVFLLSLSLASTCHGALWDCLVSLWGVGPGLKVTEFKWERSPYNDGSLPVTPPPAQWRELAALGGENLASLVGAKVEVMTWGRLDTLGQRQSDGTILFKNQVCRRNGEFENSLLKESNVDRRPREVMVVRAYYAERTRMLETNILRGQKTEVDSGMVTDGINAILSNAPGKQPEEIELTHTHPLLGLHFIDRNAPQAFQLSQPDLKSAKDLSLQLSGVRIKIRATSPNGFTFEATFLNGEQINPTPR